MFRLNFALSILAASFCVLSTAPAAFAKTDFSSSGDVNDIRTVAGRKYKAQAKATAETCPFADKSDRNKVAVASTGSASSSSRNSRDGGTVQ